jgi:hypothetical protein
MVEQPQTEENQADGAMLAAVLAAALVEYGHELDRRSGPDNMQPAGGNWRMLACLDRRQGGA